MRTISQSELQRMRELYAPHSRVELISMDDPYNTKLVPGEKGSVIHVDDAGTIHVSWDCGSSLGVVYGEDRCVKLSFDLMMCGFGNGVTLVNRAVWKNNDYKTIGHISNAGNIRYYIDKKSIPQADIDKINAEAECKRRLFRTEFEDMPELKQYEWILDSLPFHSYVEFQRTGKLGIAHLEEIREYYYSIM